MQRREIKDRRSLLDRMQEIAEEQEASESQRDRDDDDDDDEHDGHAALLLPDAYDDDDDFSDEDEEEDDDVEEGMDDFGGMVESSEGGGPGSRSELMQLDEEALESLKTTTKKNDAHQAAAGALVDEIQPRQQGPLYEDYYEKTAPPVAAAVAGSSTKDVLRRLSGMSGGTGTSAASATTSSIRRRSSGANSSSSGSGATPMVGRSLQLGAAGRPHLLLNSASFHGQSGAALAAAAAAAHGYAAPPSRQRCNSNNSIENASSPHSRRQNADDYYNINNLDDSLTSISMADVMMQQAAGTGDRRSSFSAMRFGSQGSIYMSSAPTLDTGGNALRDAAMMVDALDGDGGREAGEGSMVHSRSTTPRRVTISGRPPGVMSGVGGGGTTTSGSGIDYDYSGGGRSSSASASSSLRYSQRRQNLYRPSIQADGMDPNGGNNNSSSSSRLKMLRNRTVFSSRRASRRVVGGSMNVLRTGSGGSSRSLLSGGGSSFGSRSLRDDRGSGGGGNNSNDALGMAAAVDRLGSLDTNAEWENTVAAAAIVAASAAPPANRSGKQFSQDGHVLVMLAILNITNHDDDKETFTIAPVNRYGYPEGEGKTEAQKHGPYSFVLCTVTKVHFDEDERYYTVKRADTGTEQRADPNWMESIKDDEATVESALRAAKRTRLTEEEKNNSREREYRGPVRVLSDSFREVVSCLPAKKLKNHLVRWYTQARRRTKILLTHVLHGDKGFAFKMRVTGINFLVLCSFMYLFTEVICLAFLPARLDWAAAFVGLAAWLVLLLELIFEFLIRPRNIRQLRNSEDAFTPATARNISDFHLVFESFALLLFIPQFRCIGYPSSCGDEFLFSGVYASIQAVTGDTVGEAALGRFILGLNFLRVFGLVRHWKQMWLNHTFEGEASNSRVLRHILLVSPKRPGQFMKSLRQSHMDSSYLDADSTVHLDLSHSGDGGLSKYHHDKNAMSINSSAAPEDDQHLKNAANIGTALMVINSRRALVILLFIMIVFPMFYTISDLNHFDRNLVDLLQANNLAAWSKSTEDCAYLHEAVASWLKVASAKQADYQYLLASSDRHHLLWGQLLPVRCPEWQTDDGVFASCDVEYRASNGKRHCGTWGNPASPEEATPIYFATELDLRPGALQEFSSTATLDVDSSPVVYSVNTIFDKSNTVSFVNTSLFLLLLSMIVLVFLGLTVMRGDAGRLVLDPLRRMLKIVVRYARNPLSPSRSGIRRSSTHKSGGSEELGNYETEQLINAITKIADLLRKCWGVAGAGIISSNLAREGGKTAMFNPTVPGKRVYALFGFVGIKEFSRQLRVLDSDVMILINDVARVVHEEVYRWALGDTGQCNKNLGSAFLMVFRIGDFNEVDEKRRQARDIVFSTGRKRRSKPFEDETGDALQLASLPGIQGFADRALLSFLKSFAAIHRDRKLQSWRDDFRLGAGVGAFTVSVLYGMDAGWAVEGAVGSEYKIDATYLSPHVNMASRMMSATKQYGVTILLSQAVEELLSAAARSKLRHLDTVYVKGSNVAQQIFTYDSRYEGVDFFLFERSSEQANVEADNYSTAIWSEDQDLRSMRQHVTEEFMQTFHKGLDQYLEGDWKAAIETLEKADNLMIKAVLEEGYIECDADEEQLFNRDTKNEEIIRIRNEFGDGPCKCLIQYMETREAVPPRDWHGVRQLSSK
jgi:class 3 adenylate cyclase